MPTSTKGYSMLTTASLLEQLIECGTPAHLVAEVCARLTALEQQVAGIEASRAKAADRVRRWRERHPVTLHNATQRSVTAHAGACARAIEESSSLSILKKERKEEERKLPFPKKGTAAEGGRTEVGKLTEASRELPLASEPKAGPGPKWGPPDYPDTIKEAKTALFSKARDVLGPNTGGLIVQLLRANGGEESERSIDKVMALLFRAKAVTDGDRKRAREWLGRCLHHKPSDGMAPGWNLVDGAV